MRPAARWTAARWTGPLLALALLAAPADSAGAGRLSLDGAFTQGGLVHGVTEPDARIRFEGRPVRVSESGDFLIGFGRDAGPEARLEVSFADGTGETRALAIAQRSYGVQRIDGLPAEMVTPKPEVMERIRAEAALIAEARRPDTAAPYFLSGITWPVIGPITGVYGTARILNGAPRQPHYGVDIAAPEGTPVKAPADGIVALAHPDMYFTGQTLVIDHGHGLSSAFLHMSAILVGPGDRVVQGQPIGRVGASGRATGPHLDWRVNLFEVRLDPALIAGPMPAALEVR